MNILLTGGTGFIGSHLLRNLTQQHAVYAIARKSFSDNDVECRWLQGDLSSPETMSLEAVPSTIDTIIYLAQSKTYRDFPEKAEDMLNVNINSVFKLLEFARVRGIKKFIYASTANVYQKSHSLISETSPLAPLTFYARSKRMAEMLLESYAEYFHCVALRLFTVYGSGQEGMLIPSLVEKVIKKQPIQVQGQKGFKLSPIYVGDVISVIRSFLERKTQPGFDIFNVGGDQSLNIFDIGTTIGSVLGITPQFEFLGSDEPTGWLSDSSKLKNKLGFDHFIGLADGIQMSFMGKE